MSGEQGAGSGKPHSRLEAWKVAMDPVEQVYRATATFPASELFGLVSQMRRLAISVPSNLAQGAARDSTREFAQFLSIAKGSVSELDTQFQLVVRLGYLRGAGAKLGALIQRTSKLLAGLHGKVKGDS